MSAKTLIESAVSKVDIEILLEIARQAPRIGCFVEVGVWKGGTAQYLEKLCMLRGQTLFAYDTFEGMPYQAEDDFHPVGDFGNTDYETVKNLLTNTTVVRGVFPQSAVDMPKIAFGYIDCDQYQAIKESCEYMIPRMAIGGILYFDDCYIEHLPAATKALHEVFPIERIERARNGKAIIRF